MEWGGLLRKVRTQEHAEKQEATPATGTAPTSPAASAPAPPTPAPPTPAEPPVPARPATIPLLQRRTWASGAFLAAAARLVARGEETSYTLRRVVEWATAATGARRAVLWAFDTPGEHDLPLTMLAWAATDGWCPDDAAPPRPNQSAALLRATRSPETVIVDLTRPMEQAVGWDALLGLEPIALCAAVSGGEVRGILAVAGSDSTSDTGVPFGEDARAALAACAALAAIVFERHRTTEDATADPAAVSWGVTAAGSAQPSGEAETAEPRPTDPFLALPARTAMLARLQEEIGRARRFGHPLALLALDVDRFADWQERGGDGAAALVHLVGIARDSTRDVDLIGRGDEDELILILPVSEVDDALRVGERIKTTLHERQPDDAEASGARLTVSGGAVGYPDDGETAEDLLAAAEHTVTYAKRMGRDQIRLRGLGDMESPSREAPPLPSAAQIALVTGPRIDQVFRGLLDALVAAGDAHDQARPGHGRAVGRYAHALAEACGLNPEQARIVELAGMLHDAGKIGLPDGVLGKRGPLTQEERTILREQPAVGKLMLLQVSSLERVVPLVEYAHERYDGGGYPAGLSGNQIPFGARIIAIAEGYEAMISDRPYRRALSHSMAIAELWGEAGGRYDPSLVDTFVRLVTPADAGEGEGWNPALLEQIAVDPVPLPVVSLAGTALDLPAPAPIAPEPDGAHARTLDLDDVDLPLLGAHEAVPGDITDVVADDITDVEAFAPPVVAGTAILGTATITPAITPPTVLPAVPPPSADPIPPADVPATTMLDLSAPSAAQGQGGDSDAIEWFDDEVGGEPIAIEDGPGEGETGRPLTPAAPAAPAATSAPEGDKPEQPEPTTVTPTPSSERSAARPITGSLLLRQTQDALPRPEHEESEEGPEQLSVDDTILVMSQTTLLRMSELGRLNKRRTGYLHLDPNADKSARRGAGAKKNERETGS